MKGIDFARIRQRVGLAAFVHSLGIPLRREGDLYRVQCPLHQEHHGASLILYPDERWHCHGKCARGGDVIDLAREIWQRDLAQTVERLLSAELPTTAFAAFTRSEFKNRFLSAGKWPARTLEQIDAIVRGGFGLYDSWECGRSPPRTAHSGCRQDFFL
jgi:DNA primase